MIDRDEQVGLGPSARQLVVIHEAGSKRGTWYNADHSQINTCVNYVYHNVISV